MKTEFNEQELKQIIEIIANFPISGNLQNIENVRRPLVSLLNKSNVMIEELKELASKKTK